LPYHLSNLAVNGENASLLNKKRMVIFLERLKKSCIEIGHLEMSEYDHHEIPYLLGTDAVRTFRKYLRA
jgi:hypothetical protein